MPNEITDEIVENVLNMLDWVRPIATQMRAVSIPDPVLQASMGFLLEALDCHLEGKPLPKFESQDAS